nr:hypothetical protein [Tanacetum cinerariifolium]
METTIEQQVALDEALVPSIKSLRIGRSNFILHQTFNPRNPLCKSSTMDDILFSTIKVVSRHQNTQQYGAVLPIKLTNEDIRNTKAYKQYYACATREAAPKPKASTRRKRSGSDTSITPPTAITTPTTTGAITPRLTAAKPIGDAYFSACGSGTDEGTGLKLGVPDVPSDDSEEETSWNSSDDEETDTQEQDRHEYEGDDKDESDDGEEDDDYYKDGDESSVHQYMNQQINEAVRVVVQIQTDRLRDSYQRENDEFLSTIDDNMKRIIKKQVKSQVKDQVLRILPRIKQSVNAQLESEVLTRSSHSSRTSYDVAADLLVMELKKILIEKMEGNKSIQHSDEQRNLYKALVEAYEADKIILDTYGEHVILKRRLDDDDDQGEGPSAGSDQGSKRKREGKEPESARALLELATRSVGRLTTGSKSRKASASESAFAEEPMQTTSQIEEPHIWCLKQFYGFAVNRESALEVYSKSRIIAVTNLKIMEWHNYQYLDWILVRRDDDKVYSKSRIFAVTNLKIMEWHNYQYLDWILVRRDDDKLSNQTVEECFSFNVSLRMFTRSIVIQRRVKDLQLAVKSYQKRLNLTKPDTYRSDLKRREAYTANSNPRGFIYQNKDKKNRLMQIDELHKFSDGTLNDVRNAFDDRLKGIRM